MRARSYASVLVAGSERAIRNRSELLPLLAFYGFIVTIFWALWNAVTASAGGAVGGYDRVELLWYTAGAEVAIMAVNQRLIENLGDDIGSGSIETDMLRPVHTMALRFVNDLGWSLARAAVLGIAAVLVGTLLSGQPPALTSVLIAGFAIVLAIACDIAASLAFGAVSFWLRDAKTSWFLYQKLLFLLGGLLLPLQLLPDWLSELCFSLPFWTMAYAPARILSGQLEWQLLIGQAAWLAGLAAAAAVLFALGERRLQEHGV